MELKVWVDGIQRVVCGVTESTTCQDVVFALAHATGQTGRFTLVERWRNNERLLAPQENPLKVLMKWGEYANDVQFVLRRSVLDPKAHTGGGGKQINHSNKRQHDFLHSFSPPNPMHVSTKPLPQSKEIKKSFTFSGGHASSGSSNDSTPIPSNSSTPSKVETTKLAETKDPDIWQLQDCATGSRTALPKHAEPHPKVQETEITAGVKLDRPRHPPPYDEAISRSGSRYPASHHPRDGSPYSRDFESPSVKRRHMSTHRIHQIAELERNSPSRHYIDEQQKHHMNLSHNQHHEGLKYRGRSPLNMHSYSGAKIVQDGASITSVPRQNPERICQNNGSVSEAFVLKSRRNVGRETCIQKDAVHKVLPSGRTSHDRPENEDDSMREAQYKDLLRLVTLQREKLSSQKSEMTQFDAEIGYWETQLQEQEQRLAVLEQELRRLDRARQEQDSELAVLDQHSLVKDIELGRQEERTLHSEITLARSRLANCETELLQVRQRVHHLQEEITEERQRSSLREEQEKHEQEEQEKKLQAQIEDLKHQVESKTEEYEKQKESVEKIESSIKEVETNLSDRQKQVEKLLQEIREANLQSLSLAMPEDAKNIVEGSFMNRPGSTRKIIGSPRQLENAVPTSKNPHGVWV